MRLNPVDRKSRRPVFQQIVDQIVHQVGTGDLKTGDRLPASRQLAEELGVNRSTVVRAYQELWASGYLETRPGGYTTIRERLDVSVDPAVRKESILDWSRYDRSLPLTTAIAAHPAEPGVVDFSRLVPDERLFPTDAFRQSLNRVMRRKGARLLGYGHPLGYPDLRNYIAERMRLHGVTVRPEQVLLTTGSQNAIELVLKLMAPSGSTVVLESPTYSAALPLFRHHGVRLLDVPMTDDGPDLAAVETVFRTGTPSLFYTIPNFHNPTGITTGHAHRERLLELACQYRVPLLEDGFEEEMKYFGRAVMPIKSMDRDGVVIYMGSFSKVLFPGIRVGWVAADTGCIDRLAALRRAMQLTGSPLIQAGLAEFCETGAYDLHIGRMHREFRKRMQSALKSLRDQMEGLPVQWTLPAGGYTIWLTIPGHAGSEALWMARLAEAGVRLSAGSDHFPVNRPVDVYFRLSISERNEKEIRTGMERIGDCFRKYLNN